MERSAARHRRLARRPVRTATRQPGMSIHNTLPKPDSGEATWGRWLLDPKRSSVEFTVGHFWGLVTVEGHFDDYHGQLDLRANPAIELTINAASVQTRKGACPPAAARSRSSSTPTSA